MHVEFRHPQGLVGTLQAAVPGPEQAVIGCHPQQSVAILCKGADKVGRLAIGRGVSMKRSVAPLDQAAAVGANPQTAVVADEQAKHAILAECGSVFVREQAKARPIKAQQPAAGSHPEIAVRGLGKRLYRFLRQAILRLPGTGGVIPRLGKARRCASRRLLGQGRRSRHQKHPGHFQQESVKHQQGRRLRFQTFPGMAGRMSHVFHSTASTHGDPDSTFHSHSRSPTQGAKNLRSPYGVDWPAHGRRMKETLRGIYSLRRRLQRFHSCCTQEPQLSSALFIKKKAPFAAPQRACELWNRSRAGPRTRARQALTGAK